MPRRVIIRQVIGAAMLAQEVVYDALVVRRYDVPSTIDEPEEIIALLGKYARDAVERHGVLSTFADSLFIERWADFSGTPVSRLRDAIHIVANRHIETVLELFAPFEHYPQAAEYGKMLGERLQSYALKKRR